MKTRFDRRFLFLFFFSADCGPGKLGQGAVCQESDRSQYSLSLSGHLWAGFLNLVSLSFFICKMEQQLHLPYRGSSYNGWDQRSAVCGQMMEALYIMVNCFFFFFYREGFTFFLFLKIS